jgi:hypothetical protein
MRIAHFILPFVEAHLPWSTLSSTGPRVRISRSKFFYVLFQMQRRHGDFRLSPNPSRKLFRIEYPDVRSSCRRLAIDEPIEERHHAAYWERFGRRISQECLDISDFRLALNDRSCLRRAGRDMDSLAVEIHFPDIVRLTPGLRFDDKNAAAADHERALQANSTSAFGILIGCAPKQLGSEVHQLRRPSSSRRLRRYTPVTAGNGVAGKAATTPMTAAPRRASDA